ncbi:MAG: Tol-Pal system beta propeller repeat protein TolB [Pseudomonadales bacterium]
MKRLHLLRGSALLACSLKLLLLGLLAVAGFAQSAETLDTIIIDKGYDKQTKIAIVPFVQGSDLGGAAQLSDIVADDLARSGQFAPLERSNMLSFPTRRDQVFFRDWRILGVEYLVIGRGARTVDGRYAVSYQLFDVSNERELLTADLAAGPEGWRDIAHKVADDVYEKITGIQGAFSTKILYVLAKNAGKPTATYSLEIADADGARASTLFRSNEPILSASWAPDGQRVAYASFETGRSSIILQDLVTGKREQLTNFKGINSSPVFSPDGQQLAMVLSKDGNPEIYVMNLADRRLRRLTQHPSIDTEPSWTPDGEHLIFTSDRGSQPQIYQLEMSSNFVERLTYEGNYNARARMLADGEHMILVHRAAGVFHIAWLDIPRDDLRVLTSTSLDESPSVAPNGAMLIYATQSAGKGILAVVSVDGRVKYRLPSEAGDVREPAWSPYLRSNVSSSR